MSTSPARTVHLYVFEGFADWEAAQAIAAINQPAFQRPSDDGVPWRVVAVGAAGDMVRSMGGLAVVPDTHLDNVLPEASAMLILPGGPGWEDAEHHAEAEALAERFAAAGTPVAAICGATAGLARAGLLDDRVHTSNALAYLKGTGYAGTDRYDDSAAVTDRGVITAGGMAPVDFAREILALLRIYEPEVLAAWYDLYKTGDSRHWMRMTAAAGQATAGAG